MRVFSLTTEELAVTPMDTIENLLTVRRLEVDQRPAVTFVDAPTGERTELSGATLANWVAKTANLLIEDLRVVPGDRVVLAAGTHWTSVAVALATWRCGGSLVPVDLDAGPPGELPAGRVAFVREDAVGTPQRSEALVILGNGLGGRLSGGEPPMGALVYGEDVLAQPDDLFPPDVAADTPALTAGDAAITQVAAVGAAREAGWEPGTRLLVADRLLDSDALVRGLLGVLAAGGSLVLARGLEREALDRLAGAERTTARFA